MSVGHTPAVFISSTCYDLKHVRSALKDIIENQLGYEAIMSETSTFPIAPGLGTVDNCLEVVKNRSDIFVLIIGGRYGFVPDNNKSITNLEYIEARAKGIPIYTFIEKSVLSIFSVWKQNPSADFSNIVDTPKLFEFIDELYNKENIWIKEFDNVQDITGVLKKQFGYLFADSLQLRQKVCSNKLSNKLAKLEGEHLKIVLEKPFGWEFLLFAKTIENRFYQADEIKRDYTYGIYENAKKVNNYQELLAWVDEKTTELTNLSTALSNLFNKAAQDAIGANADAEKILYIVDRFGSIYIGLLKCGLEMKTIVLDDSLGSEWDAFINSLSPCYESPINDLDQYREKIKFELDKFYKSSDETIAIDLTITLSEPDLSLYYEQLKIIRNIYLIQ